MSNSNVSAPTQFLDINGDRYAYRRFGKRGAVPLLLLQHFTGTLDNWDPAVTDPLALERDVILFDNAGVGRSSGSVPCSIAGMALHALASSMVSRSRHAMCSGTRWAEWWPRKWRWIDRRSSAG